MGAVKLLIFDADKEYANNLSNFLVHNYSEYFGVCQCSRKSELILIIETFNPDILLVSEDLYEYASLIFYKKIAVLSSGMHNSNEGLAIYKYKNANSIVGDLLGLLDSNVSGDSCRQGCATNIIMIHSAVGGSGKTLLSLLLAQTFANKAKRVFYLNMESCQSTNLFLKGQNNGNFAQVLYYLKNGDINLASRVRILRSIDESTSIFYFEPSENIMDNADLNTNDVNMLIKAIKESDHYDFIIIDSPSTINSSTVALLEASNKVVCITDGTHISLHKTKILFNFFDKISGGENLEKIRNITYIAGNKIDSGDEFLNKVKNVSNAPIACVIPVISDFENLFFSVDWFENPTLLSPYIDELINCLEYT